MNRAAADTATHNYYASGNMLKELLRQKIQERTAKVGVVGLGYVGLPFAVEKAKVGFEVTGIDENPVRAAKVSRGENYIRDVNDRELRELVADGRLKAYSDFSQVQKMDVVVICVPTPLTKNLTPDLSHVEHVAREIAVRLRPGQLISLESTTYPGTTEELILPILESSGLEAEKDFFLVHSPERVDPGNRRYTTRNTSKVLGGVGPNSTEVGAFFYSQTVSEVVTVSSARAAELVKVFENTFRAVNIALVNELAMLCDRMGLNVWEVLEAAFTKPFGIMPFYPGPGVGGHCIPVDPHYLEWRAKELAFDTRFIGLAGEINRRMPHFVREKIWRILNHQGVVPSKALLLFVGVTYKKDVPDTRESPALKIMELLLSDGAQVYYHDPLVPEVILGERMLKSSSLNKESVEKADLVIITTDHSGVDYPALVSWARSVFDTRNITSKISGCAGYKERITLL